MFDAAKNNFKNQYIFNIITHLQHLYYNCCFHTHRCPVTCPVTHLNSKEIKIWSFH